MVSLRLTSRLFLFALTFCSFAACESQTSCINDQLYFFPFNHPEIDEANRIVSAIVAFDFQQKDICEDQAVKRSLEALASENYEDMPPERPTYRSSEEFSAGYPIYASEKPLHPFTVFFDESAEDTLFAGCQTPYFSELLKKESGAGCYIFGRKGSLYFRVNVPDFEYDFDIMHSIAIAARKDLFQHLEAGGVIKIEDRLSKTKKDY